MRRYLITDLLLMATTRTVDSENKGNMPGPYSRTFSQLFHLDRGMHSEVFKLLDNHFLGNISQVSPNGERLACAPKPFLFLLRHLVLLWDSLWLNEPSLYDVTAALSEGNVASNSLEQQRLCQPEII